MRTSAALVRCTGFAWTLILFAVCAEAGLRVEQSGTLGPEPVTGKVEYPLEIMRPEASFAVEVKAVLTQGSGSIQILDPGGVELYRRLWSTRLSEDLARLVGVRAPGPYRIAVETDGAVGVWRVRVIEIPEASQLTAMYLCGPLLAALGLAFILGWRLRRHAAWRWFAAGAAVRVVSYVLILAGVLVFHFSVRDRLEDTLPHVQFLLLDSAVVGVVSGLAMALTLLFSGMMFSGMQVRSVNAVAVGIGAGAGEAIVSGFGTHLGTVDIFSNGPKSAQGLLKLAYDAALTPLLTLVEPVKFVCIILCFMAAGALVMLGLSARRWVLAGYAALLVAGIYASIGATRIWALEGAASKWWIVCGALPFAAISVLVLWWCLRVWPPSAAPGEVPMEAYLKQFNGET